MRREFVEAIEALEKLRVEIAMGCVVNPQGEPFKHGLQAGQAQGLAMAQDCLRNLDTTDEDRNDL